MVLGYICKWNIKMNDKLNTDIITEAELERLTDRAYLNFVSHAAKGNANDQYLVGLGYDERFPTHLCDSKEAVKWYSLAAAQGHSDAQTRLGTMYECGDGVAQDYKKAMEYYLLAADRGNIEAQFLIGTLYMHGHGAPHGNTEDMGWYDLQSEKALKWLALAAKQGHSEAQETLRREFGFLVPTEPKQIDEAVK